jgi:hypothetical protein
MNLAYVSPVPWESFAQRPHKFVEWFHKRTGKEVLWIDPYPTRLPTLRDFRRVRFSTSPCRREISAPTWLTVIKPAALPIEPIPGSAYINSLFWHRDLDIIKDHVGEAKGLLAIGKPSTYALNLLKTFHDSPSLYDAMDDFPAFYEGLSRKAMERREREVAQRVSLILASSSVLNSRWANMHRDVRLVQNGLDFSAIHAVAPNKKVSHKRVFGYVGTIASWFDWDWVYALAVARPNDEIRLIGPVFKPPLRQLPVNIKLMPACDHAVALKAMSQFDVGLIPFKINLLTASVDPIKYYEYIALGLPVISSGFGEMGLRAGERGVFITHSLSDVSAMAEAAMRFEMSVDESRDFAKNNSWEVRFDEANILPTSSVS